MKNEKLVKTFVHYHEYLIIWKQTKKKLIFIFILTFILTFDLGVLLKKVKQFNQ